MSSTKNRAVFLDRDGTLNADTGYVGSVADVCILPGVERAVNQLKSAGFITVVVSNQSGVGRGLFGEGDVDAVNHRVAELLKLPGNPDPIDRFYYCPHHPEAKVERYRVDCACRKPAPGLMFFASAELGLNLAESYLIGDSMRDIEAGINAGLAGCVLLGEFPPGFQQTARPGRTKLWPATDILSAVGLILSAMGKERAG